MNKVEQAVRTFDDWMGDGGWPVEKGQASGRAQCCLKCPKHGKVYWLTRAVIKGIKRIFELKNSMKISIPEEGKLHGCMVCNCDLRLKVHVPIQHIVENMTPQDLDKLRQLNCWITNEQDALQ
jgi:hypothetical protein